MRKVNLRMNEEYKYKVIKKLVDTNGNKNNAATKLNCTKRTINRLIIKYKQFGKAGFIHGNRDHKPATTIDDNIKQQVITLYRDHFLDTNLTHFSEILSRNYNIKVSDHTINYWLKEVHILSPKAKRKTKKSMTKKLKDIAKNAPNAKVKNEALQAIEDITIDTPHPRRPRCAYFGEMIQMDASSYQWFGDSVTHLHVAIDDATGKVVGAYFDTQETLNGYYNVFHQILTDYGIPAMFFTDRRTVFEYTRKNAPMDDEDTFTQFSYACHQMGVSIKTSSIAQAKGRVERLNQTLQSRLPVELRLAGVTTIEEANLFLKFYLKEYNDKFSLQINSSKTVFELQPEAEKINQLLAVISPRKIDTGHCIKYKNKLYIPHTDKGIPMYLKNKTDALVIEAFDGVLYANVLEELFILEEVEEREKYSKEFDNVEKKKPKKKYIPPMTHPWKHASYMRYLQTQSHRNDGANV